VKEKIKEILFRILLYFFPSLKYKGKGFKIKKENKEEKERQYYKCVKEAFEKARKAYPIGYALVGKTITLSEDVVIKLTDQPLNVKGVSVQVPAKKILAGETVEILGYGMGGYVVKTKDIEKGYVDENIISRNFIKQLEFYHKLVEECRKKFLQ
jgi:hypothetical protein